jgi:hypothetical protein
MNSPDYSNGVRQTLVKYSKIWNNPNVTVIEGGVADYAAQIRSHRYCMAPTGHGWGIRLAQYMVYGCVPLIIQVGL